MLIILKYSAIIFTSDLRGKRELAVVGQRDVIMAC